MAIIIYENSFPDLNVEPINLNGRDGAIEVTDHDEDTDITFQSVAALGDWIDHLVTQARLAGFPVRLTVAPEPDDSIGCNICGLAIPDAEPHVCTASDSKLMENAND